ncbi:DUF6428 family protein [Mucilaginibacter auburnensis]|uniref:Uncharacterized protein n=1 Tax=Mucilaginibacter auburnensis TaxID=1457233 RepID=A0A2H9VV55_9SPHI|nr:DUF6428 family protein [Mucilaginibacter auburnensis]PJJ84698.1 hypothetical protein CLV57_1719 [Mucilaginibacter auburnensis]
MEHLKWHQFKEQLNANTELTLQFQYAEGKWVDAAYHITEVKQAPITSVDCGGVMNAWTEIIVQLYEPLNEQTDRAMKVSKALSIINVVEKALPLHPNAIVKIEFGNSKFDTRQMLPQGFINDGENLIVDLRPDTVQCKANDRGGSCGTPEIAAKPKIQLQNLAAPATSCAPGSGCC